MQRSALVVCLVAALGLGCSSVRNFSQDSRVAKARGPAAMGDFASAARSNPAPPVAAAQRQIIRSAQISVEVDDINASAERIAAIAERVDGLVENSSASEERAHIRLRVPSSVLDATLDEIADEGNETSRNLSAKDVTEQIGDLDASLSNDRALRDRLRLLLERAKTVEEVLKVENQLNRLQTRIDQQEGRLKRLRSQVELSSISVRLDRTKVLGPLGYVYKGVSWAIRSLFVIR